MEVLDPTHGGNAEPFTPAPRRTSLAGLTVGIVSNGKQGTHAFFDALDADLRERHGVAEVVRVTKPNYSAPAGGDIINPDVRWQVLVAGIGD
jgi:hypothetical protein